MKTPSALAYTFLQSYKDIKVERYKKNIGHKNTKSRIFTLLTDNVRLKKNPLS